MRPRFLFLKPDNGGLSPGYSLCGLLQSGCDHTAQLCRLDDATFHAAACSFLVPLGALTVDAAVLVADHLAVFKLDTPCASVSTIAASWVAMTTVVPVRLIRSRTFIMPIEVAGSMFPVGSSASGSWPVDERAGHRDPLLLATGELVGHPVVLALQAHQVEHLGDNAAGEPPRLADTSSAKATFCSTVLFGSGRKSWNTQPILRRSAGTFQFVRRARSLPATRILPSFGAPPEDQPEERGLARAGRPTRKTNSPLLTVRSTFSRAARFWLG